MSSVDFSRYDARTVRKFFHHILEANDSHTDRRNDTTPISTAYTGGKTAKEHDSANHIKMLESKIDAMQDELNIVLEVCEQALQHLANTDADIIGNSKKKLKLEKKDVDALEHQVRKLETIHTLLKRSGACPKHKLEEIEGRIKAAKKRIKNPSP
jgi:chromosome segregation ATPase